MQITRWAIADTLPERRTEIVDRLVTDAEFRALCQDYQDCETALQRFREQAFSLPNRIEEYEQLLECLEEEIRQVLNLNQQEGNEP